MPPAIPEHRMRLPYDDAVGLICNALETVEETQVIALEAAAGRIAAVAQVSQVNLPPADVSAMDGIACRHEDLPGPLRALSSIYAESDDLPTIESGNCARIMTGGAVPPGADTVIIRENVSKSDGGMLTTTGDAIAGQHIRRRGESLKRGETVIEPGRRIKSADLGLLASAGVARVTVKRRPRVAVFSSGSELAPIGSELRAGQIYESNALVLASLLRGMSCEPRLMPAVADDGSTLEKQLRLAASEADAVVTSGGVSVGDRDLMPPTLAAAGKVLIWKVMIKPGLPFLFGKLGGTPVFGLPGNPVSSVVTLLKLVAPGLARIAGIDPRDEGLPKVRATLGFEFKKSHDRAEFMRVRLDRVGDELVALPTGSRSSARLRSLSDADGLIMVPPGTVRLAVGSGVWIELLPRGY